MVDPLVSPGDLNPTESWQRPDRPWAAAGGRFGRYQIERLLGKGGMGAVYLARQLDLGRQVVIKVIAAPDVSPMLIERFHREGQAAARIASDHVVKVYDVGVVENVPFIAMEFVNGQPLDTVLAARRVLPFDDASRIVLDAARGLQAAHEVGILHRDVKPGNLLLTREGRVKVTDFGLAKGSTAPGQQSLTQVGTTLGTPAYMPPEQAEAIDVLDARADVYALGVTFYEMLTGSLPFPGRSMLEIFQRKQDGRFVPPSQIVPGVPQPIEQVCATMMARHKTQRPASMADVVQRLEAALAAAHGGVRPGVQSLAIIPQGASLLGAPSPTTIARTPGTPSGVADDLPPGTPFGRYQIQRLLGRGGMASVYLARQTDLERPVVIKVVHKGLANDPEMVERLKREAAAAARIESDFVVRVFDAGIEGGIPFIAMEYVEGTSLADLVKRRGKLSPLEATRAVLGAARGLKAAHELGILHRDVKPANVLVSKTGKVKVADFGIAKLESAAELTAPGTMLGTPIYAAPEQIDGLHVDARADLFSLGVTYYQLLAGEVPFAGTTAMQVLKSRSLPVPPPRQKNPGIPESVERACLMLMETDRERRPKDMAAAIELLQPIVVQLSAKGGKGAGGEGARPAWLVPALAGGGSLLLIAVVLGLASGKKGPTTVAGGPSPTPEASPAPSATPTPSPAPSPAATPSPTAPRATPNPTPSATPAPSPSPAPTSAPSPAPLAVGVASPSPVAPSPEASIAPPAPGPSPAVAPSPPPAPSPTPSPAAPAHDDRAEGIAREALAAARKLAPAESSAALDRIVHDFPGTQAATSATLEKTVVDRIVAAIEDARQKVETLLQTLKFKAAEDVIARLEADLGGTHASELATATGVKGKDERIDLARKAAREGPLAEIAALKTSKEQLDRAVGVDARSSFKAAVTTWKLDAAQTRLRLMREAAAKLGDRVPAQVRAQIETYETVLRCVEALAKAATGTGLVPDQAPSDGRKLGGLMDALHAKKDLGDDVKIGGQLAAACYSKPIPPDLAIETKNPARETLSACLKILGLTAPSPGKRPGDGPPPDDAPPDPGRGPGGSPSPGPGGPGGPGGGPGGGGPHGGGG